jgi:hypothetical protein
VFGLVVALVYYSRTGVTRAVSEFIVEWLAGRGLRVDVFELRALREYARPLHLNPRLIFDTIFRGFAEYGGDEGFKPDAYDLVFIGTVSQQIVVHLFVPHHLLLNGLPEPPHRSDSPLVA